jgi:hypothetical protein
MRVAFSAFAALTVCAGPALSATCHWENPAGGSIPYECPRGEELKVDAPSLGESNIPAPNQRELDAIRKLMEGATAAEEPVQAAPN